MSEKKEPEKDPTYEEERVSPIQKKIESRIEQAEENMSGGELDTELSRNRTHMSEHRTRMSEHRTDLSEERSNLSIERTRLSYDRTMMSWVRTSTSLLTFGFSISKFFQEIDELMTTKGGRSLMISAREVGIILILISFLGLLTALIQNHHSIKELEVLRGGKKFPKAASVYVAYVLLVLSLFLLIVVAFRIQ